MKALVLLGCLLGGATAIAQTNPPPAPPPEARQFDFWIGDWEVYLPDGRKAGENRIERMAGGWGLLENWKSANPAGGDGKSLNSWHPARRQWQQFWVGQGGIIELAGGLQDGRMVMTGEGRKRDGGRLLNRITWTPNADGTIRQLWEQSSDDGTTWAPIFDGMYRRKAAAD